MILRTVLSLLMLSIASISFIIYRTFEQPSMIEITHELHYPFDKTK